MDGYSHWIGKYVLVQDICLYGSCYASLHSGSCRIWWFSEFPSTIMCFIILTGKIYQLLPIYMVLLISYRKKEF